MMVLRILFCLFLLLSGSVDAKIGDGDTIDFTPLPNEFCNSESNQKQRELLAQYPKDEGIIKLYASYLGLCQLVAEGVISEYAASIFWAEQRNALIQGRKVSAE